MRPVRSRAPRPGLAATGWSGRSRGRGADGEPGWPAGLTVAAAALLGALPLGQLAWSALVRDGRLRVDAAWAEVASRGAWAALVHSLETSLASALLATLLGAAVAAVVTLCRPRGSGAFSFAFVLSMMVAPQVTALAFLHLASPVSPLLGAVGLAPAPGAPNPMRSPAGIIGVLALHHAPLAFVTLRAGLRRIPRELVDAAALDGAGPGAVALRILVPLLRGHGAAAFLLCFVAALGNFGIPALLGLPANYLTIPTLVYRRLTSLGPSAIGDAASVCLPVMLLAFAASVLAGRLARGSVALEHGAGIEGLYAGGRGRVLLPILLAGIIALALVLPLASLLATALVPAYGMPLSLATATLDHVAEVFLRQEATLRAFRNSLLFAAAAALVVAGLALPLAYALARRIRHGRTALETLLEAPYALPGVGLSVAFVLLALRALPPLGLHLYGTATLIVAAYASRFLALGLRPVMAALAQADPAVEDAARLCGAGLWTRLRAILLPAAAPSLCAGALLVFLLAVNELTVSAILWSRGTETIGVVMFSYEEAGLAPQAAVVALAACAIVAVAMLLLDRLVAPRSGDALPWR